MTQAKFRAPWGPAGAMERRRLQFVDAATDDHIAYFFTIHLFGLHGFCQRVGELVVLPKFAFGVGQFHALFDELFAIWVFQVHQILADLFGVLSVGHALASHVIHRQIQIAIGEGLAGRCEVDICAITLGLDGGNTFGHDGLGFGFGGAIACGEAHAGRDDE